MKTWQKPQFFLLSNQIQTGTSAGATEHYKFVTYFVQTAGKNAGAKCMTITSTQYSIVPNGNLNMTAIFTIPTQFGCS